LSRSCKNSTHTKEKIRRMAKPMEFVQETYKQITDTFSFRIRTEKDMEAISLHGQNHYTVSNFGRVTSEWPAPHTKNSNSLAKCM